MNVPGWAFKPNEKELCNSVQERFKEIKHLLTDINLHKRPGYNHVNFTGELTSEAFDLSERDILILADYGNLCFGGSCTKKGNLFSGSYNTD